MSVTQEITSEHVLQDGRPAGGESYIDLPPDHPTHPGWRVLYARWQDGPLLDDTQAPIPNGVFVETIIAVAIDRLQFYEKAGFGCDENREALAALERALDALDSRTRRREEAAGEGTHEAAPGDAWLWRASAPDKDD